MATALTPTDLASMQSALADLLPDTCVIYTGALVSDGEGGGTFTWTAAGTVACRLDSASGGTGKFGAAITPQSGWTLTVPFDTNLVELQQVTHGGYTYTVTSVDYDKSWAIVLRAHLERQS